MDAVRVCASVCVSVCMCARLTNLHKARVLRASLSRRRRYFVKLLVRRQTIENVLVSQKENKTYAEKTKQF